MTDRQLLVHVDLDGAPAFVGRLWARQRKGRESASFEYDASWLKHPHVSRSNRRWCSVTARIIRRDAASSARSAIPRLIAGAGC